MSQATKNQQDRIKQLQDEVTRLEYAASKLERQYENVDPTNRLIASTLEERWERALQDLANAKIDLSQASEVKPESKLSQSDRRMLAEAGKEMPGIWEKCSLDSRKRLLRTLIVQVNLLREAEGQVCIRIVWKGGLVTEIDSTIPIHSRDYDNSPMERKAVTRIRLRKRKQQTGLTQRRPAFHRYRNCRRDGAERKVDARLHERKLP